MIPASELLHHLPDAPTLGVSTGLTELDTLTTGLTPGRAWVVVGRSGQGRSSLAIQLASQLAQANLDTALVAPREPSSLIAARLVARLKHVPLPHLMRGRGALHLGELHRLMPDSLNVWPSGTTFTPEEFPGGAGCVVVVDDAHRVSGVSPDWVFRQIAAGSIVILTMPRDAIVVGDTDSGFVVHEWAEVTDVVLDVRLRGLDGAEALRPGEGDVVLLRNRLGFCRTLGCLAYQHFAEFADMPPPAPPG